MSSRRLTMATLCLAMGGLFSACAEGSRESGEDATPEELLAGDGSEFPESVASEEAEGAQALATAATDCAPGAICRAASVRPQDLDRRGPHNFRQFNIPRGLDHGGATVYYPTDAAPPFAYAVYCPPYTATQIAFSAWGPFFASHGIVLATMDTLTVGDYPPARARQLVAMMSDLRAQNTRRNGPLEGKLDESRAGVLGWSMGGGGVWIASGDHPEWKSAVTLAGHNLTATGWERSARRSTIPTLMLNGATDLTYLGGLNQSENAYQAIPNSTPKILYVFSTLGHFEWGSPSAGNRAVGRYVMAWEKTFLEGDERYRSILQQKGPLASKWQSNL